MTAYALITGTLHKDPAIRTSANGNPFTTATVRFQQKNRAGESETLFASVTAFREDARATLGRCREGDAVSCGGSMTLGVWERDGRHHPSLNMVADTVATARPAPRGCKAPASPPKRPSSRYAGDGFDDPLAF